MEFSRHERISKALQASFYFAKPYHAWERGLNAHTNGLLCQYFPKFTDFSTVSDDQLNSVENLLNDRLRHVLNFSTLSEVYLRSLSHHFPFPI